jgi:hypothetical protein
MMPRSNLDARRRHFEAEMARGERAYVRYALSGAAIAAVLVAAIAGIAALRGSDTTRPSAEKPSAPAITPTRVTVQIFNGTTATGLARKYQARIDHLGFVRGAEPATAPPEGFKAESVIFYKPGQKAKAELLRKELGIKNVEPLDDVFANLTASKTQVVLVVGRDAH